MTPMSDSFIIFKMKKSPTPVVGITATFVVSVMVVGALLLFRNHQSMSSYDFKRIIIPDLIRENRVLNINYNSYYLAGITDSRLFLGNFTAPLHLLSVNSNLTDTAHYRIKVLTDFEFTSIKVKVDSPYFYLMDGTLPKMLRGTLSDLTAMPRTEERVYFREAFPLNSGSFVFTGLNSMYQNIIGKVISYDSFVQFNDSILERQIDGLFCTDGQLSHDKKTGLFVYVYNYRNQFICFDSSLNILYRGNTIDPIAIARIEVTRVNNTMQLKSPPLSVNKRSYQSDGFLFNVSNLRSKEESHEAFEDSSVVDIYRTSDGTYSVSFYIPNYKNLRISSFAVSGSRLYALYDQYLVLYDFDKSNLML